MLEKQRKEIELKHIRIVRTIIKESGDPIDFEDILEETNNKIEEIRLKCILRYLEKDNKIIKLDSGYLWIFSDNPKLEKAIAEGASA